MGPVEEVAMGGEGMQKDAEQRRSPPAPGEHLSQRPTADAQGRSTRKDTITEQSLPSSPPGNQQLRSQRLHLDWV